MEGGSRLQKSKIKSGPRYIVNSLKRHYCKQTTDETLPKVTLKKSHIVVSHSF